MGARSIDNEAAKLTQSPHATIEWQMTSPGPTPPLGNTGNATTQQLTCWTPTRNEIKSWMQRNAPSLAELYEGAVTLLYSYPIPGHVRFVAHAVREIRNRLPDAISGPTKRQRLDYTNRLDDIAKLPSAQALIADLGGPNAPTTTTITIDRQLAKKFGKLLQDHRTTRTKPLDAARRLFESIARENTTLPETLIPIIQQWFNTTEWFMKKTHDPGRAYEHEHEDELRHHFSIFENTLAALIKPFFDTLEDLDAILEDTNN
jgi:hypothetical protein